MAIKNIEINLVPSMGADVASIRKSPIADGLPLYPKDIDHIDEQNVVGTVAGTHVPTHMYDNISYAIFRNLHTTDGADISWADAYSFDAGFLTLPPGKFIVIPCIRVDAAPADSFTKVLCLVGDAPNVEIRLLGELV